MRLVAGSLTRGSDTPGGGFQEGSPGGARGALVRPGASVSVRGLL